MKQQSKRESTTVNDKCTYWETQISDWKRSGQTQVVFCAERRLALGTFQWWRAKLNNMRMTEAKPSSIAKRSSVAKPSFLPVPLSTTASASTAIIEIELPTQTRLRFEGEAALRAVAALVERVR